jgi:hypothetical protein
MKDGTQPGHPVAWIRGDLTGGPGGTKAEGDTLR